MDLKWDNTNLGSIDEYLSQPFNPKDKTINMYWKNELNGTPILIFNYRCIELHLVLDKIKKLYGLQCVKYHIVSIKNYPYLISYDCNTTTLSKKYGHKIPEDINRAYVKEVRKALAFQWIIGMSTMKTTHILHRGLPGYDIIEIPVSYGENYIVRSIPSVGIPPHIISEWFDGKIELLYLIVDDIFDNIHQEDIKSDIRNIVINISDKYSGIINSMYEQITFAKNIVGDIPELKRRYRYNPSALHLD
jgi:hypothetical protein